MRYTEEAKAMNQKALQKGMEQERLKQAKISKFNDLAQKKQSFYTEHVLKP